MLAHDVEKVLPEAVVTDKDGFKTVSYNDLIPLLLEAVKEQKKEIQKLETVLSEIKTRN